MRKSIIYTCDVCGKQSTEYNEILMCECSHLEIDFTTLQRWKALKKEVRNKSAISSFRHNSFTEAELDYAIRELIRFEKAYGLEGKDIPELL